MKPIFLNIESVLSDIEFRNNYSAIIPGTKTAGVEIVQKIGAHLKEGDVIMKIYAKTEESLQKAIEYANGHPVQELASMTIARI